MGIFERLRCPQCQLPLQQRERSLSCGNNHCFDQAKQGYFNLLPVQKKRSKTPGDSNEMVRSRREFLNQNHYLAIAEKVSELAAVAANNNSTSILDCGCGEGYYSQHIIEHLPQGSQLIGLDMSKEAVKSACKRNKSATWIVASGADIPVADHSIDQLICLFTPLSIIEFQRVLKPGGQLIIASTGADHLVQLRQEIYSEVKRNFFDPQPLLDEQLGSVDVQLHRLNFDFELTDSTQILQLLAMTPHQWRASASAREHLKQLKRLKLTADVTIYDIKLPC